MRWSLSISMASVPTVWAVDAIEPASCLLNPAPDYTLGVKP